MNLHAAYFSPTGTTKKIVTQIAQSISMSYKLHDFTMPNKRKEILTFQEDDLLILGLPVYAGRIPGLVEAYVHQMKGHSTPVVLVAVYGNRDYDDALLEMKDIMTKHGFYPIAAGAFIGEHSYTRQVATNRPDKKDLLVCNNFSEQIKTLINRDYTQLILEVKGNSPYRQRHDKQPLGPSIKDQCFNCRLCAGLCPSGALSIKEKIHVDDQLCIRCHACVKSCPIGAIDFDERIDHVKSWLIDNYSERKEAEFFIGQYT